MARVFATNPCMRVLCRLVAAAATWALASHALCLPVVPGEAAIAPKEIRPAAILRLAHDGGSQARLTPLPAGELEKVRGENQRTQLKRVAIGRNRALPRALAVAPWVPAAGGLAAKLTVASPDAGALRIALDLAGLPLDVEMVFQGSEPSSPLWGPVRVGDIPDRSVAWWSPVTEGDAQRVEFFAPHVPRAPVMPRAVGASHLFTTPSSRFAKRTQDLGDAGPCNVDLKCSSQVSMPGFLDAAHAVAEMVFSADGYTYLCTGTLINDTDPSTQVPWFYSANHCFDNPGPPSKSMAEMQAVAPTLSPLWFFEANACNGALTALPQLSGGATVASPPAPRHLLPFPPT